MPASKTTFSVPAEIGHRLRGIAKHRNTTVGATLAALINRGFEEAGLGTAEASVAINLSHAPEPEGNSFEVDLLSRYRVILKPDDAKALCSSISAVLDKGGRSTLDGIFDVDMKTPMSVVRRGAGLVIEGHGRDLAADDMETRPFVATMSCATAEEIRRELAEAIADGH